MINIDNVKQMINKNMSFLKSNYFIENIGVFGSVVTGENTEASDIDILVKFSQPIGMFKFIELEEYLSKILGKRVDLVTQKALKPAIKDTILNETIYI